MFRSSSSSSMQGLTRKHSSRMRTTCLRIVRVVVATTRCQYRVDIHTCPLVYPLPLLYPLGIPAPPDIPTPPPEKNLGPDIVTCPQKAPGTRHPILLCMIEEFIFLAGDSGCFPLPNAYQKGIPHYSQKEVNGKYPNNTHAPYLADGIYKTITCVNGEWTNLPDLGGSNCILL